MSFENDGEEELLKPKRSHLRIFCGFCELEMVE